MMGKVQNSDISFISCIIYVNSKEYEIDDIYIK